MEAALPVLAGAVFVAFAVEALAGFGATVIALTVAGQVYPVASLLPVVVPLNIAVAGYIAMRHRAHIDRAVLLRGILPLMAVGVAGGILLAPHLPATVLQRVFGALVVSVAVAELWKLAPARAAAAPAAASMPASGIVLAAGVVHGVYACGGPLLVWALGRTGLDRRRFRSTLAALWVALNAGLVTTLAARGEIGRPALGRAAALLPVVVLAVAAGEWAHVRLDERRFRLAVFAILLAGGLGIALRG